MEQVIEHKPAEVKRFVPTKEQYAYMRTLLKVGLDATQKQLAEGSGVVQSVISRWHKDDSFLRWRNEEVMRLITAEIPASTAFAIDTWLRAVKQRAQLWRDTDGAEGRPPTDKEMGRLLQLADRFNLSLYVPEGAKHVHLNLVNVVVNDSNKLPEDQMLVTR